MHRLLSPVHTSFTFFVRAFSIPGLYQGRLSWAILIMRGMPNRVRFRLPMGWRQVEGALGAAAGLARLGAELAAFPCWLRLHKDEGVWA
jgi:hypothetical protein